MRHWIVLAVFAAICVAKPLYAQTLVGTWQGTTGKQQHVLKITKERSGALQGEFYDIGFDATANPISAITLEGHNVKFDLDNILGTFEGVLAADGKSIVGSWQAYDKPQPLTFERASEKTAWVIDPSPHKVQFVTVDKNVRLEVLDWGGEGPPLVFLAGAGNTAHVFDNFAPKFADKHHVYGITRRGFGISSAPPPTDDNYDADRLGDDVLVAIDALKLNHPILAGHSIAGQELSSIGTRHPERVAALVYLDATSTYAVYNVGDIWNTYEVDIAVMRRDLAELESATPARFQELAEEIQATVPRVLRNTQTARELFEQMYDKKFTSSEKPRSLQGKIGEAMVRAMRKYSGIKSAALVIIAGFPPSNPLWNKPSAKSFLEAKDAEIDAVRAGMVSAQIAHFPQADHYVWRSNEADVLREMNAFMDGLH